MRTTSYFISKQRGGCLIIESQALTHLRPSSHLRHNTRSRKNRLIPLCPKCLDSAVIWGHIFSFGCRLAPILWCCIESPLQQDRMSNVQCQLAILFHIAYLKGLCSTTNSQNLTVEMTVWTATLTIFSTFFHSLHHLQLSLQGLRHSASAFWCLWPAI